MTKDEALKLALEALKYHTTQTRPIHQTDEAIAVIEAALTPPTQEPTCPSCGNNRQVWTNQITGRKTCHRFGCTWSQPAHEPNKISTEELIYMTGVYDGKKQRPWVGLTEADYSEMSAEWCDGASWAEDKLKEKNFD